MNGESVDAAVAAVGNKATYAGAGATTLGWLTSVDFVSILGLAVAVAGLIVNVLFKIRDDRRKQRLCDAQIRQLEQGTAHDT